MEKTTRMPGFTAENTLGGGAGRYARVARATADDRVVLPQQLRRVDALGDTDAPATTCTCPCCQTVNGRLWCC